MKNFLTEKYLEKRSEFGDWNYLLSSDGLKIPFTSGDFYPLNPAKVLPRQIKKYLENKIWTPIIINFRAVNNCSDNCFYCQTRTLRTNRQNLSFNDYKNIIIKLAQAGVIAIRFDGLGEPLLIDRFEKIIELARREGILVSIISNGTNNFKNLDQLATKASFIRFSLDAATKKTHDIIHFPQKNDNFDIRIKNIKKICDIRSKKNPKCIIGGHFVINQKNFYEIIDFAKLMKKIGADFADFCLLKTNVMTISESAVNLKKSAEKYLNQARSLETKNFHILYRDGKEESGMIKKKLLENYLKNGEICWQSYLRPTVNAFGQLIGCGKYEEQARFSSTTPSILLTKKTINQLINHSNLIKKFKSAYCFGFGPCYFTSFNYKVNLMIKKLKNNPQVTFSRVKIKNGQLFKFFD
ncbi:MAG: radical SAM protein [Microgenomates group bacterium]|nr:radical SAM protein [Microgenomates group bacterium]